MKKLLAMVLALVMTLSLAVSASAASFEDAKDINETYAEAVDVLAGLKVFQGYDNGKTFKPTGDITRAEVAAIVYRIYTGDVKDAYVKNYETYNKFSDMAGAGWAKGYIGYCANAALVKGYPDGTFKPSGKVTGYEVLAMILRAVGYDQKGEFTGADWALHVAEIAEQNKILKNVKGIDLNKAATRELVAELLFEAIQVPMVTYTAAFGYQNVSLSDKGSNGLFAKNETLGHKTFKLDRYEGYVVANDYGTKYSSMIVKGENAAKEKEEIKVADQDIFDAGRYGHVWTSDKTAISSVFYDDTLLATKYESWNTDWTTKGKTDFIAKEGDMNYFLNGKEVKADDIKAALAIKGSEKAIYDIDGDGDIDTVIVVNPIVDIMNADYVVKGDEVKIQGVKYDKDEVSGYEDLVKDDVFTYVDMADGVRYFEELSPIEGQKTKYTIPTKGDAYITFDGKDYEESGLSPDKQGSVSFRDTANLFSKDRTTFDKDATIYLDRGGYVAYTTTGAAVAKYAMVIDSYQVLNDKHNGYDYFVNLLLTDGTETGYVKADGADVLFPTFEQVKESKTGQAGYIGQPEATGNYIKLGTLVEYTVKDDVYTIEACDKVSNYLSYDYDKGEATMTFSGITKKAVTEDSVAYYFYGTPNSTNFESTPSKKVDVHYGVNTGKYDKDTNEAGIPSYASYTGVNYLETSSNGKIVDVVVFAGMPMGEYEDYVYLFKCEKETWTSGVGQLYTYYGVNSAGEVKEFESYNAGYEGEVCYYFQRNDKTYDFMNSEYMANLVSVSLLGNKNTVEYRFEGQDTEAWVYSNLDKAYDLTDTSSLKDGDKAETYDWKWMADNKTVEGLVVVDKKGNVECLFVLDDDVTFGEFTVNGETYYYPVADANGNAKKMALSDLDNGGFEADKYYHIDGAAQVKGSDKVLFEAGKSYNVVLHTDPAAITVTAANANYTLNADKTVLTVPFGTDISTAEKLAALVTSNATVTGDATNKTIKLVLNSTTCDCKNEKTITVVVAPEVGVKTIDKVWDANKSIYVLSTEAKGYTTIESAVLAGNVYTLDLSKVTDLNFPASSASAIEYAVFTSTAEAVAAGYNGYHYFAAGNVITNVNSVVESTNVLMVMTQINGQNYYTAFSIK